jgi:hypothetical protein
MYYDRRVPPAFLDLLLPGAALGWLVPWLTTPAAARAGAHVQTRRDRGGRRHGGIQLYLGRTSPLEVRARPGGRFQLHADPFYRAMAPALFATDFDVAALARAADALRAHAEDAATRTHRSFLDGEAVVHAGLMRHYGPLAPADAPFVALDSEARVGFDCQADQDAYEAALPALVGLPAHEALPRKLDLVGLARDGRVLLVEVKADPTGLARAAWQAAVHVARLRSLLEGHPTWITAVLGDLAREKARVGLLGRATVGPFTPTAALTPVIAAPDPRPDWAPAWRRELAPVLGASRGALTGLRLWRLTPEGRVAEDVAGEAPG